MAQQVKTNQKQNKSEHQANQERTMPKFYTAKELAEMLGVTDATIRTRWMAWIVRVEDMKNLKAGNRYTERCRQLLESYAAREGGDSEAWVQSVLRKPEDFEVYEGEIVDDSLALVSRENQLVSTGSMLSERSSALVQGLKRLQDLERQSEELEIDQQAQDLLLQRVVAREREVQKKIKLQKRMDELTQEMGLAGIL